MASGDTLVVFRPLDNQPPSTGYATLDLRNEIPVLDYDDSSDESAVFSTVMPRSYAAGGITVTIGWAATSATTGDVKWDGAFERHQDDVDDLDSDSFATAQSVTDTTASAAGEIKYSEIVFTAGQVDGLAAGEHFRFKLSRDADAAGDTLAGDAELLSLETRES